MPGRIAVIDDNVEYVQVMKTILPQVGYEVRAFSDCALSPTLVGDSHPDAVILDLHFPGTANGWTLLEEMRRLPALETIPIIVCSADIVALHEQDDVLARCRAVPLEKPFDLDDLLDLLGKLTLRPSAHC